MPKVKLASLVQDWRLYPRHEVDSMQIRRLKEALVAGEKLPAILVDKDSMRIVDGFHRYAAHLAFYGEDGEIDVVWKTYPDERALFREAARLNSRHGVPMDPIDQRHCILRAAELQIPLAELAVDLAMPLEKLEVMAKSSFAKGPDGAVILKAPTAHLAGRRMTRSQVEANDKLTGMRQEYFLNRVTEMLEEGLLNLQDEHVRQALRRLEAAMEGALAEIAA